MTSRIAGYPESKEFTNFLKEKWKSYGLDTKLSSYDVLLNYAQVGKPNVVSVVDDSGQVIFDASSVTVKGKNKLHVREMDPIAAYSKSGEIMVSTTSKL